MSERGLLLFNVSFSFVNKSVHVINGSPQKNMMEKGLQFQQLIIKCSINDQSPYPCLHIWAELFSIDQNYSSRSFTGIPSTDYHIPF